METAGNKVHYLLWTGGWDSTFRLLELSFYETVIQPIYISDPGRGSRNIELAAMEKISRALQARPETRAMILPLLVIPLQDIPNNSEITEAYLSIKKYVPLGIQYEWIPRLALLFKHLEIGIEKPGGEYSGCIDAIERFGGLCETDGRIILDRSVSSAECISLFGNLDFPISSITETEMVSYVKEWGCEDIMSMIWFCYSPVDEKPCGICRPCRQKMECGMEFLLTEEGHKRYREWKINNQE